MIDLRVENIVKRYGTVNALDTVSLDIPEGTFTCLLGPSGCGKTTLLRIIAGLELPDSGRIELRGQDISNLPAHKRDLGMVFQSLALFPHLNVADNIAYGLKLRGVPASKRRERVRELLDLIQLQGLEDRSSTQLSGGQRQRVAIARALALEPKLFLLDEPLSALDAKLREDMQVELRDLQRRLGVTTVLVTHDQREAMTMADMIVVMDHGTIRQAGAPLDVYRAPADRFVADFLGGANLIDGVMGDQSVVLGDTTIQVGETNAIAYKNPACLCIRAEDIEFRPAGSQEDNCLSGRVSFVRDLGHQVEVTTLTDHGAIKTLVGAHARGKLSLDDKVVLHFPPAASRALKP